MRGKIKILIKNNTGQSTLYYIYYFYISIFLPRENVFTTDGFIYPSFTFHFVGCPQPGRSLYEQERCPFLHKSGTYFISHCFWHSGYPSHAFPLFSSVNCPFID